MKIENKICSYLLNMFHTPSDTARKMHYYVQWVGHFVCEKGFLIYRKDFKSILIIYTLNGSGLLKYRGKQYELLKNQLMIIDCSDLQEYYTYNSDQWEFKWIHFYGNMSCEYFNYIYENYGPVIYMPEENGIAGHIDKIIHMVQNGDPFIEIKASSIIHQMLTTILLSATMDINPQRNFEYRNSIKAVQNFIEENYQKHVTVDAIADAANLSRCHFSIVFKRITGFSPHEYLTNYRISKAKSLLNNTKLSIEDIALEAGFADAGSFIRTFKKLEDSTPLKYRNNLSRNVKK